jgi:hypothetical protein
MGSPRPSSPVGLRKRPPGRPVSAPDRGHQAITDPNFRSPTPATHLRVQRPPLRNQPDIQALFEQLPVEDPGDAFYLGTELMKASLALLLGKTHVHEWPLRCGYLTPEREDAPHRRYGSKGAGNRPAPRLAGARSQQMTPTYTRINSVSVFPSLSVTRSVTVWPTDSGLQGVIGPLRTRWSVFPVPRSPSTSEDH